MHEPTTIAAFEIWLRQAKRGDRFIYHIGLLYHDRTNWDTYQAIEPIDSLATRVWERNEAGQVVLIQRKGFEPGQYIYEAVKT